MSAAADYRFEKKKKKFITANKDKDKYYDYWCSKKIHFDMHEALVYQPKLGKKPWFTNVCLMVGLDFLMLGWIPRYFLIKNTKLVKYEIIKYIHK
jgi:hypothetical protein